MERGKEERFPTKRFCEGLGLGVGLMILGEFAISTFEATGFQIDRPLRQHLSNFIQFGSQTLAFFHATDVLGAIRRYRLINRELNVVNVNPTVTEGIPSGEVKNRGELGKGRTRP